LIVEVGGVILVYNWLQCG
ncbi:unnamed protein product, partial [Allacma fusca]